MAEQDMPKRDRAERQPDREPAPREQRRQGERASKGDLGESDAARRQARQDPLQHRDR